MINKSKNKYEQGFTLVELMIALSIFSTILVISTLLLSQIGRLYTKGVNQAAVQNATRNISSDISTTLQFSGDEPIGCLPNPNAPTDTVCYTANSDAATHPNPKLFGSLSVYAYCIGKTRYSYVMNHKLDVTAAKHILWKDTMSDAGSCDPLDLSQSVPTGSSTDGYELAPKNTRLTRFKVVPGSSGTDKYYTVDVWMAYGDDDLVDVGADGHPMCKGDKGTEFCATSVLTTVVTRRI